MKYTIPGKSFFELPVTTGTVQNIGNVDIEISNEETAGTGIIIKPGERFSFADATVYVYAKTYTTNAIATISVVPFKEGGEGGGGTLPIATKNTLGGIKVGNGLSVATDGTLSATGSSGEWQQITKLNVVAPLDVDIDIPYTNTFKMPPVEVLKYTQGVTNVTTNVLNFGVGDGSKFEVDGVTAKDSPIITFDGVAKPNHDVLYRFGTPTQMVDKYYSESEEIDLNDYKVVEEMSFT